MAFLGATTSLPAVYRPNDDRWNAARSCQWNKIIISEERNDSLRILKTHIFVPQLTFKIVKKLSFGTKDYFVDFWPLWGLLAILNPFQSSDHSEIEILAHWAIRSRYKHLSQNKLFDSSTGNPSNGLKMALKWPLRVQKWPKFSKTLES